MVEENDERVKLSVFYRLILKFPKLSVEGFSAKFQGFFWVVGLPIFLICYTYFNLALFVYLSFPYNYVAVGTVAFFFAMFIFRILLERALSSAEAMRRDVQFWREVDEAVDDYLSSCKKLRTSRQIEEDERIEELQE